MNKKTLILIFLFLLVSQTTLIFAATTLFPTDYSKALFGGEGILGNITKYVFGYEGGNIREGIVIMAVWLIIFVAVSDMVSLFATFSSTVSWLIGFGLAVIAANTGFISGLALWAFGAAAALGAIATLVVIVSALLVAVIVHLGLGRFKPWLERRGVVAATAKGAAEAFAGIRVARGVAKAAEGGA
ncbi:hypothetical protein HZA33_02165 [Candidatus Pacearchaeota archaeon]|nr:hypothetical protein [Candidatus Pacearchaeota archaeon]